MADPTYTFGIEYVTGSFTNITTLVERGNWGTTIVDEFHPPQVGRAMFELSNDDGTLSPRVNSSFQIGRAIQLTATHASSVYPLFFGRITEIAHSSRLGARTTLINAVDDWDRLQQLKYTTALFTGTRVNSVFTALMSLSAVRSFTLDSSLTDSVGYAWYRQHAAVPALNELVQAGAYQLLVDGNGTFTLKARPWTLFNSNSGNTPIVDTASNTMLDLVTRYSRELVFNRVRIAGRPLLLTPDVRTIAYTASPIRLNPSGSVGYGFNYFDFSNPSAEDCPVGSVITPVASTDWYVAANSDGSGADLSSTVSLVYTGYAASAVATFTNNGATSGWITRAQVRGYPLQPGPELVALVDVASSQTAFGVRTFEISNRLLQDWQTYLDAYATTVASAHKDGLYELSATLVNEWPAQLQSSVLGKIVMLRDTFSGPTTTWRVRGQQHDLILTEGLNHTTLYALDTPKVAWAYGVPDEGLADFLSTIYIGVYLAFEGAQGATTTTDAYGHTCTFSDTGGTNLIIDRAQYQTGISSLYAAATNVYVLVDLGADDIVSGTAWGMRCYIRSVAVDGFLHNIMAARCDVGAGEVVGLAIYVSVGKTYIRVNASTGGTTLDIANSDDTKISDSNIFSDGTWHSVEAYWYGGTLTFKYDGTTVKTYSMGSFQTITKYWVGSNGSDLRSIEGNIDQFYAKAGNS